MSRRCCRAGSALLLGFAALLTFSAPAGARWRDCGQPVTTGETSTTTDALSILRSAVGIAGACELEACVCDISGDGALTTADAIRALKLAVGQNAVTSCDCAERTACDAATLTVHAGSAIDHGWTGIAHDDNLPSGSSLDLEILRRCGGSGAVCASNADCGDALACEATCDCVHDPGCELAGPVREHHCSTSLQDCKPNRCRSGSTTLHKVCETNADCSEGSLCEGSGACPNGDACRKLFMPPIPLSSGGTPVCWTAYFRSPIAGTADLAAGSWEFSAELDVRVNLGIQLDQPCPRCGAPEQNPRVGQTFVCEGGQFHGATCRVDAVCETFGGTSFDCPSNISAGVSGSALTLRLSQATTGTTERTAELPCANLAFRSNPLNAPTNPGRCLDDNTACTSNADCTRCSEDASIACTTNQDCTGNGVCAEAPDQPITCGYWCHCGFCNGNASLPCFETGDCPQGQTCQVGPGAGSAQNGPQQKPNDCSADHFVCGELETERCAATEVGECSDQPYRYCQAGSTTCEDNDAGSCIVGSRPCFEPRITRTGLPSALGRRCDDGAVCATNADCASGACGEDAMHPEAVAVACMPASSSSSINNVGGITGPATLRLRTRLDFHRE